MVSSAFLKGAELGLGNRTDFRKAKESFLCQPEANYKNESNSHPDINIKYQRPVPDVATVKSELSMNDKWDTDGVSALIHSKSANGETPAFLFLGRKEAALLTEHLTSAFGPDSVTSLHDVYYMGLDAVMIDCESFVFAGGCKTVQPPFTPLRSLQSRPEPFSLKSKFLAVLTIELKSPKRIKLK